MQMIIIGGGIGGLAAAVALKQVGIESVVFERSPELREVGAGLTLWTNAVKVLRRLGLGDAVSQISTLLTTAQVRTWNGRLLSQTDLGPIGERLGAPTIGVHRADLQRVLAERVGPGLKLGAAYVGHAVDESGATVRFADGREDRGDLLIGADGIHSKVREHLFSASKLRYAGYTAWRGVAMIDRPEVPLGSTLLTVGRGSEFGYLPIGHGRTYWFCTARAPEGESDPPGQRKAALLERFAKWYAPVFAVIEATDEAAILRNDIVDRPPTPTWGVGRASLLGDAIHPTTPHLGQGAAMAIESAFALAKHLSSESDRVKGLRNYEQSRFARTAKITNTSRTIGKMLILENSLACWLRDLAVRLSSGMTVKQTEKVIGYEV